MPQQLQMYCHVKPWKCVFEKMKWHQAVKYVKNAGMKKQTWQKEPGGNTLTDYKEYMKTLEEQIQNKRARALVAEEINGHIEEQAQGYEEEGMSREDAKERQCGRWEIRWKQDVH